VQAIVDLLQEANFGPLKAARRPDPIEHVRQAIDAQVFRLDRVARLMQEEVLRKTIHIETNGEVVGQINGLSVLQLGNLPSGNRRASPPPCAWGAATWSTSSVRST
jgi:predicted ATP-dependent protease